MLIYCAFIHLRLLHREKGFSICLCLECSRERVCSYQTGTTCKSGWLDSSFEIVSNESMQGPTPTSLLVHKHQGPNNHLPSGTMLNTLGNRNLRPRQPLKWTGQQRIWKFGKQVAWVTTVKLKIKYSYYERQWKKVILKSCKFSTPTI
jgi:hypothetical protein